MIQYIPVDILKSLAAKGRKKRVLRAPMTYRYRSSRISRVLFYAWIGAVVIVRPAEAQLPSDFINIFKHGIRLAVQAEWRKLPPDQTACIEQQLLRQQSSIDRLIDASIFPYDPRIASIRTACRITTPQQIPQQAGSSSVYGVDNMRLGSQLQLASAEYQEYRCEPSEQFAGFTWCQKQREMREARGTFNSTWSMLHSSTGTVAYVNRSLDPAFFAPREVEDDISRLTRKHGSAPRIQQMPANALGLQGTMAIWGDVDLEPLDQANMRELASQGKIRAGLLVDYLGKFQQSAQAGLPVYRMARGAGFVWVGNWNQAGRGNSRFFAVDMRALTPSIMGNGSASPVVPNAQDGVQETIARLELERKKQEAEAAAAKAATEEAERRRVAEAAAAKAATEEAQRQKKAALEAEEKRRIEAAAAQKSALEVERQKAAAEEARALLERERARNSTILWSIGGIVVIGLTFLATFMIYRLSPRREQNAETKAASDDSARLAHDVERVRNEELRVTEENKEAKSNKRDDPVAIDTEPETATERLAAEDDAVSPSVAKHLQNQATSSSRSKSDKLTEQFAELNGMYSAGLLTEEEFLEFKYRLSHGLEEVSGKEVKNLDGMSKIWAWLFALSPIWLALRDPLIFAVHRVIPSQRASLYIVSLSLTALFTAIFVLDYRQIPLSYGRWTTTRVVVSWLVPPLYFYWRSKLLKAQMYFVWVWVGALAFALGIVLLTDG